MVCGHVRDLQSCYENALCPLHPLLALEREVVSSFEGLEVGVYNEMGQYTFILLFRWWGHDGVNVSCLELHEVMPIWRRHRTSLCSVTAKTCLITE